MKNSNRPAISVLMSVCNGGLFLKEAIDSVLSQSFADFEFLIIDDASSDNSREIMQSYNDPRIRLFLNQHNLGLPASLNILIEQARGKFFARLDCDDIALPERFFKQIQAMELNGQTVLLATDCVFIDEKSQILLGGTPFLNADADLNDASLRWLFLFPENPVVHSSVLLRADVINENGLRYDVTKGAEDLEFWHRLSSFGQMKILAEPLVKYRVVNNSFTSKRYAFQIATGRECALAAQRNLLGNSISDLIEDEPLHLAKLYQHFCAKRITDSGEPMVIKDLCKRLIRCLVKKTGSQPSIILQFIRALKVIKDVSLKSLFSALIELVANKIRYSVSTKRKLL